MKHYQESRSIFQNHFLAIALLLFSISCVYSSLSEDSKLQALLQYGGEYGTFEFDPVQDEKQISIDHLRKAFNETATELKILIKELKHETVNINIHARELENVVNYTQESVIYMDKEISELKKEVANYSEKVTAQQTDFKSQRESVNKLATDVNALNAENSILKAETVGFQRCCSELKIEINNLRTELLKNITNANNLITVTTDLMAQLRKLEEGSRNTEKEVRALREQITNIKAEKTLVKNSTEENAKYDAAIQSGYTYYPGMGYYKCVRKSKTWLDAFQDCVATGGHLLIINSEAEVEVFKNVISSKLESTWVGTLWVGITDFNEIGKFHDIKGNTIAETGYTIWAQHQPNNLGGHEHCISVTRCGLYHDYPCKAKMSYVCEIPAL